jgi:hypothetical protein
VHNLDPPRSLKSQPGGEVPAQNCLGSAEGRPSPAAGGVPVLR